MAKFPEVKRRDFGALGLSAAALLAMQAAARGDEHEDHERHPGHDSGFDAVAVVLNECQLECDACFHHCMMMVVQGNKKHLLTMQTCLDCANVCSSTSHIVARKGPMSNFTAAACADVCAACAKECEKFPDDEHMARCAKACRRCEKACRDLVENAGRATAE